MEIVRGGREGHVVAAEVEEEAEELEGGVLW